MTSRIARRDKGTASLLGAALALTCLLVTLLLLLLATGPKHDEGLLILCFGMLLTPCAVFAALASPGALFSATIFPSLWCIGALGTWFTVASIYDYSLVNWPLFGSFTAVALISALALLLINACTHSIHRWLWSCRKGHLIIPCSRRAAAWRRPRRKPLGPRLKGSALDRGISGQLFTHSLRRSRKCSITAHT